MIVQTLEIKGRRMVQLPERDYLALLQRAGIQRVEGNLPPLPKKLSDGNYPALEFARASLARKIIQDRRKLGLSQAELARRAGIPVESLNRLERARTNPTLKTVGKIDRALKAAQKSAR